MGMGTLVSPPYPSFLSWGLKVWQEEAPAATDWSAFLGRCSNSCSWWPFSYLQGLGQINQAVSSANTEINAEYFLPGEIIGGQEALPHSHPYMAYLLIRTPRGLSTCGGFLVREDFVMTSARCWGSRMRVILGAHNIRRQERTQQSILVLRAIRHPRYNQQNQLNDLMLLQLENRARRNRFVRPVALPQSQIRLSPGSLCTVAGWGLVSQHRRTDTLRDVQLSVQSDQECSNYFDTFNDQKQICVGNQIEGKTTFLGDTGGPLVCNNVAQGIVSYGRNFGVPPTVFTRIARFLPWINRTMNQLNQKGAH